MWSRRRHGLSKLCSQGRQGGSIAAGGGGGELHSHLQENWGEPDMGHTEKGAGRITTSKSWPAVLWSKPWRPPSLAAVLGGCPYLCAGQGGMIILIT